MWTLKSTRANVFELPVAKLVTMRDIKTMADFIQRFYAKNKSKKTLQDQKKKRRY
jgi:hypothetical protein